ncbi:hypothetical protein RRG08_039637 [Elysia crispata]|uniref:Uncharacterized protein n=1 Tax=Elysia crispata TaxID=231223 RepID=A0AAE0Y9U3_9GAST|nr:hypothetical protein RRG08_039637 [Elysia crispata]
MSHLGTRSSSAGIQSVIINIRDSLRPATHHLSHLGLATATGRFSVPIDGSQTSRRLVSYGRLPHGEKRYSENNRNES